MVRKFLDDTGLSRLISLIKGMPDDKTIEYDSVDGMRVKDGGITEGKLDQSIVDKINNSSVDLSASVDNSTIEYSDSKLKVKNGGIGRQKLNSTVADGSTVEFSSSEGLKIKQQWIDDNLPDIISSSVVISSGNGELDDFVMRAGQFMNSGAGWNTFTYPTDQMLEDVPVIFAWCEDPTYSVQVKSPVLEGFMYQLVAPSVSDSAFTYKTTSDAIIVHYVAIGYWGD